MDNLFGRLQVRQRKQLTTDSEHLCKRHNHECRILLGECENCWCLGLYCVNVKWTLAVPACSFGTFKSIYGVINFRDDVVMLFRPSENSIGDCSFAGSLFDIILEQSNAYLPFTCCSFFLPLYTACFSLRIKVNRESWYPTKYYKFWILVEVTWQLDSEVSLPQYFWINKSEWTLGLPNCWSIRLNHWSIDFVSECSVHNRNNYLEVARFPILD